MTNVKFEYDLVFESKLENVISIQKFKSKSSGITIYIAENEGPLVHGLITLATEAEDDDGLPHTLEHLIFLGSEDYPYKGVLDLVANRCLASGTNACTDIDSTFYTISTAGSEGFRAFLPMYLDHILFPTLTESGFITEVHHVNEKGEDGGVVYCEMQGCENTSERLVNKSFMKTLYPGFCGYNCVTGGALKSLRETTTHEKVKKFHHKFYHPENMCIIVIGKIKAWDIFASLNSIEEKIKSKIQKLGDFIRPWQSPIEPLLESTDVEVKFPDDDEKFGLVKIGWRAPPRTDIEEIIAIDVMLQYLYKTSISPLQQKFIEVDDPLCSEINCDDVTYMHGYFSLNFENVPMRHLFSVKPKLFEIISKISLGKIKIDMSRLGFVIQRQMWSILSKLECEPKNVIRDYLIGDFVHGSGNDDLEKLVNQVRGLEHLKSEKNIDWWQDLVKKFMFINPHVSVVGKPSLETKIELANKEKERVEQQRQRLGEEGLRNKLEILNNAIAENEILPPVSMIESYKVPDIQNISFHPIFRSSNYSSAIPDENSLFPLKEVPYRIQVDDIKSQFATIYGIMDTSFVPQNLKLFLPLLMELLLESPVLRSGELISHGDVINEISKDTVEVKTSLGLDSSDKFKCGPYAQMAILYIQVDLEHYIQGVSWLHDLLFFTKITPERVSIVVKKMLNDVAKLKRDGYFVVKALAKEQRFTKESNNRVNGLMRQYAFLTQLLAKLKEDATQIINALEKLKVQLTSLDNITVHIATDVSEISRRYGNDLIWKAVYSGDKPRKLNAIWSTRTMNFKIASLNVQHCHQLLSSSDCETSILNAIVGLGSVESSFLLLSIPSLSDFEHPDLPSVLVFCEYLCQLEGPLWKQLRGLGLAYSYSLNVFPNEGSLSALLYRSTDIVTAFEKFSKIVKEYTSGNVAFEVSLLESARSSLLFELISKVDCVKKLSEESLKLNFCSLNNNYLQKLLKLVSSVSIEDLQSAASRCIPTLLDPSKSFLSICCNSSKVDDIQSNFAKLRRNVEAFTLDESFMDQINDSDINFVS